jgi:exopolyphosphatase/guanosine-5'-triphosphate,3'-diphosphate pyrophosphatase
MPASSYKEPLRLAEHLDDGKVTDRGVAALTEFVGHALELAEDKGCEEMLGFATSAVRDATNSDDVLKTVHKASDVELQVLPGDDEARLTFLAVRRWFGWSAGRIALFDIGGGSLEIAAGADEAPEVATSVPLGAGRLTRQWLTEDPPSPKTVKKLRAHVRAEIGREAGAVLRGGAPDHAVATSKTFRSLARICGSAPSGEGPLVRRVLAADALRDNLPALEKMTDDDRKDLPGVSASRSHQLLAGAIVADAVLDLFELDELEICPWALREGVILERLDALGVLGR